jgi:NTP pyrophosphatase (non-canonical NTP hydrolase)
MVGVIRTFETWNKKGEAMSNEQTQEVPGCPTHPQSGTWYRKVTGSDKAEPTCSTCGTPFDANLRSQFGTPAKAPTIRTFDFYREIAERTDDLSQDLHYQAGCLCEESGEFIGLVKKVTWHGHAFTEEMRAAMVEELGDILYHLDRAAQRIGRTLGQVAEMNYLKRMERYKDGFSKSASINRSQTLNQWSPRREMYLEAHRVVTEKPSIVPSGTYVPQNSPCPATEWPKDWLVYCQDLIKNLHNSFEFARIYVAKNVFNDLRERLGMELSEEITTFLLGEKIVVLDPSYSDGTVVPK